MEKERAVNSGPPRNDFEGPHIPRDGEKRGRNENQQGDYHLHLEHVTA